MAFLLMVAPLAIAVMKPSIVKEPGVIEYGFAALFFCGAIETAGRFVYFHRRRRQIQIEDGTLIEPERENSSTSAELLDDLTGKNSKGASYSAKAAVFGLLGCITITITVMTRLVSGGHWVGALLVLVWSVCASRRWIRKWKERRPLLVFDSRFSTVAKFVSCFGVFTLLLLDVSWARGRLPQTDLGAVVSNLVVVLSYAGLLGGLARWYRLPEVSRV